MSRQKNLKRNLLICLLAGSAVMYTLPLHAATSVVANNALPNFDKVMSGALEKNPVISNNGLTMDITQTSHNAVIKWNSFDVGGSATVNFWGPDKHNTLNYVNSANMSQIYGTINANNNGNIFIVNPAGVQIGPSAQINVGSLYVSNSRLSDDALKAVEANNKNFDFNAYMNNNGTHTDAALMSLGNINATNVTFEGDGRIVIDSERLINGNNSMGAANINIKTKADNTGNVIIGYEAYDEENKKYTVANDTKAVATVNGTAFNQDDAYMWVEDVEQLQAINTNLGGNYALRNSIDATSTDDGGAGFKPIGLDEIGKVKDTGFTGKFDGIDYNIFGLTINNDYTNVGLFGETNGATINNVTLVGGSVTGAAHVGAVVGSALNGTVISNVINSASVNGIDGTNGKNIGGIVGVADDTTITNAVNTGAVDGKNNNVGGLVGLLENGSTLNGNSYNLGDVSSEGHNVGGLVGHAVNSTIGNPSVVDGKPVENVQVVYNRLDVEGAYNVGGIVGNMEGTTVQNSENSGNVMATGYTTDTYIYYSAYQNVDDGTAEDIGNDRYKITVTVNAANVGGIAGTSSDSSTIENVANTGDVNSRTDTYEQYGTDHIYYTAGNVGGVVGRAEDTNITNATNRENEVRGAHNVGGVAGYFGGEGTVNGGINDGGDIMATGARYGNDFMTEHVRSSDTGDETFIIGNIGGVVGYMDGDNVYVTGSANRGTVHSQDIDDPQNVLYTSQAANTGGVVGRINRSDTKTLAEIQNEADKKEAAVNNSYNTGDVRGYAGVGGVVGMMYNGEVANSYNLGAINTTRRPQGGNKTSVNMGGVVGDTTEESNAKAIIYNVYNKGQIGDETYNFYARHVGGVVGRLSGTVDKAYNTGAIYNGYSVVGGIAGWFYEGTISNSFNTGNITVLNKETAEKAGSQVGGIAGGMSAYGDNGTNFIYNAYNLGTLRSFNTGNLNNPNSVGGIVGKLVGGGGADTNVSIRNVYTTSNIYSGTDGENASKDSGAGSIYGDDGGIGRYLNLAGANYIELGNSVFNNLEKTNANVNKINYNDRYNSTAYNFVELNTGDKIWADVNGANVSEDGYWRIYKNEDGTGTTPILNAFLPNAEDYFSGETGAENPMEGISSIQYGTAYDPLLTIIKANEDLTFDWGALGIQNDGGLAVYNAGLTLTDFKANGGTGYFGGIIYADESLNLNGTNDIGLGSASQIYGSDVTIETNGKVTIYGDVTSTGNQKDNDTTGNITINAGDVDVYGTLTSAKDEVPTKVSGIAQGAVANFDFGDITNKDQAVTDIGNRFAIDVNSSITGNITINAGTKVVTGDDGNPETITIGDGNVNLYYGNKQEGLITTGGDLIVTGKGDVYVDSDLNIGGNLTLTGNGANSEVVLDLTNIGQVQADNGTVTGLNNFLNHFAKNGKNTISFGNTQNAKITVDMWNGNTLNLDKFGSDFTDKLDQLKVTGVGDKEAKDLTHIWVNNGEQLKGIQEAADKNSDILGYNFALKGDINASDVTDYEAIGGTTGFTGTFDGRGNRIIGLDTTKGSTGNGNILTNAGIFSTVGTTGVVKNVNIYSGNFNGTDTAGAVAGVNKGRIENVTGFGNTVEVIGAGIAGGIVGKNEGKGTFGIEDGASTLTGNGIYDVQSIGSVITASGVAGGLVGINDGALGNSYSDSAVTSTAGTSNGLGGVVGVNTGDVQFVDSLGVTNGGTNSDKVGGIIGVNNGNMYSGYNESIVSGKNNVGGIIGQNDGGKNYTVDADGTIIWNKGTVENVVNATGVTGSSNYVGGLVGTNTGSVTNGRNNGTITGTNYVGGLVGDNADEHSILTNLVNDSSAEILGEQYVGGIAGSNSGKISATNDGLTNRGSITGNKFVGGVAGVNTGEIANTISSIVLNAKGNGAQFFGGVVGQNSGLINGATNTSDINITAVGGSFVGGIIGQNTESGKLKGEIRNEGSVAGQSQVGGIIGQNNNDKVLQGTETDRLIVANDGTVDANEGGAAGIFYENNGDIKYADISNSGDVDGGDKDGGDKDGGTGGLFGINTGNITESTLTNSGTVSGGGNVGGLIGVNSGNADNSSLTNTGSVTGINNVGGLIGENTGTITGGRDDNNSYYKDQIYNNGTITGRENGSNIGGLIGSNTGSLTAGYNTGEINASGSENVGGIVGNNAGTVDQVFNTVMTGVDNEGKTVYGLITGGTNVGGLVGTNSGTLSNAYNTTAVEGSSNVGNAVGNNTTGTITNIYASNTSGNLIGAGYNNGKITNAYSFSNVDNGIENITVIAEDDRQNSDSYNGFDFDSTGATQNGETAASDGDKDYWKIYAGSGNPLLKVFLTKVTVDNTKLPNLVYNTQDQDLNIGSLTGDGGAFSAEDDFKAYQNNNSLIQNTDFEHKNAGTYDNWLYSDQIAAGSTDNSFNPNNLGYDIDFEAYIDKAQITVDLNQVDRVYGDTATKGEYGFSYGFNNVLSDKDKAALIEELNKNALNMNTVNKATDDTGLIENGTKTNDAGIHSWTGTVNIADDYKGNYEFVVKDSGIISNNGATITTTGKSVVNQRKLSVSDIVASIVYGNQDGKGFIVSGGKLIGVNSNDGIVYGDNVELNTTLKVEDANIIAGSSYAENKGNRDTADAGRYENSLNFSGLALSGDDANNYVLVNDSFGGTIEVTQATIKVDLNDVDRTYGSTAFNGNGYGISNVQNNANGDIYTTGDFVVNVDTGDDGALTGDNSGRVTNDVGNYTYIGTVTSNNEELNQNYNIVVNNSKEGNNIGSGVSTVTKADLSIIINDVDTTYGTAFDESQYGYTIDKLVNGDGNNNSVMNAIENAINNASGGYHNTGAADGTNGKVTQDAEGDYSLSFKNDITKNDVLTNYNITVVNDGDVNVSKKQIHIGANNEEIHVGEAPDYTGTDINGALVNGDKLSSDYHYGVADSAIESVVDIHNNAIGVWIGNTFYDLSETVNWTQVDGFFANYNVTFVPGTLTVTEQVMPDLPDNWPNNRWDYLFADNPFDRNENFRERKAEVNFVDGAMEI